VPAESFVVPGETKDGRALDYSAPGEHAQHTAAGRRRDFADDIAAAKNCCEAGVHKSAVSCFFSADTTVLFALNQRELRPYLLLNPETRR
jgi:hypothetical protein